MQKIFEYKFANSFLPLFSLCVIEMDTSTYSHGHQNIQSAAQRKFYQWVLKWINGVASNDDEIRDIQQSAKPDVRVLASFLQTIGFKLLSFEKHNDVAQKSENSVSEQGALKITIECGTSNMRAMLKLEGITCRCPNPDHIKDASFWSVSGTGPTASTDNIVQKVEETGSTLLPPLAKDVARVLRDVSYKLFDTIVCEPDVNRNTDISISASRSNNASYEHKSGQDIPKKEVGVMRSNTQPEIRLRADSLNSKCLPESHKITNFEIPQIRNVSPISPKKSVLQRQRTWNINESQNVDEEPRPSPPKLTSSPVTVPELSNSLGQISLQSDIDSSKNITEYIIGAQQNLEKALKMLLVKKPIILNDVSANQALDEDSVSVKSAPAAISPTSVSSPYKSTGTNVIDNLKFVPKQNNWTHEQLITKAISRNTTQVPKARRSIEPILSKSLSRRSEQDNSKLTVRRSSFYIPSPANSNIAALSKSETKQKLLGIGRYSSSKTGVESEISNRVTLTTKGVASPEPRKSTSATSGTPNGRVSLIKPPTKISKSMPVKVNTMQSSKINTGIARKPRLSLPKD